MKHRLFGKRLDRGRDQRKALFRNLVTSLVLHEQIETTEAKAKAVKGLVDKVITKGKTGSLHARRTLAGVLTNRGAIEKVIKVLVPRSQQRTSGFTRIIRLGRRKGDNASLVKMELVDKEIKKKEKKKEKKEKKEPEGVGGKEKKARPGVVETVEGKEEKEAPAATQIVEEKKPVLRQSLRDRIPSFIKRPPKKG